MSQVIFIRLTSNDAKSDVLQSHIDHLRKGATNDDVNVVDTGNLRTIPCSPFSYWLSNNVRRQFHSCKPLDPNYAEAARGITTCDDFRFIRLFWEVDAAQIGRNRKWATLAKGGEFSPFHSDISTVVQWENEGHILRTLVDEHGKEKARFRGEKNFYRIGLTYPNRNTKGFNTRILPSDCVISHVGQAIFPKNATDLYPLLAVTNSRPFQFFLRILTSHRHWEVGAIQQAPVPSLCSQKKLQLGDWSRLCVLARRSAETVEETAHCFVAPAILQSRQGGVVERLQEWGKRVADLNTVVTDNQRRIDDMVFEAYGLDDHDKHVMDNEFQAILGGAITDTESEPEQIDSDQGLQRSVCEDEIVADLLSYTLGIVFGRWDVRCAIDETLLSELPDPCAHYSVCPPGMLQGTDGLPAHVTPEGYPLSVSWDGVIVDDGDHTDDILRRIREVFELVWENRTDNVEKEVCEILGEKELRDYFRRPGQGGFWDDHISRYSKSRRKAPIYWLLQSSKKNYALWLYYHRLDKDLLFKALVKYVEPKIRLETSRLESLRSQKAAAGESGKEAKRLAKDVERQEDFLSELRDFEDKLRRAANLHLEPDLNDGVVLNIAPLHELVPWKEAKKYCDELMEGQYEWSSIGKQLREKGLVK